MPKKFKKDINKSNRSDTKINTKTSKYLPKSGSTAIKRESVTLGDQDLNGINQVEDADTMYISAKGNRVAMLTNAMNRPESHMTPLEKMSMVRLGVSKKDLVRLKEKAELDYDELAKALSVTRATLINKKGKEKFNKTLSERIVGLADIYSYGYEVFENEDRFNQWMFSPNKALGGQAPYELLDNQFGREEVRNIIGRIDYGVYS